MGFLSSLYAALKTPVVPPQMFNQTPKPKPTQQYTEPAGPQRPTQSTPKPVTQPSKPPVAQYKDVNVVTITDPKGNVGKIQITDNTGKVLRDLKPGESVKYTTQTEQKPEVPINPETGLAYGVGTYTAAPSYSQSLKDYYMRQAKTQGYIPAAIDLPGEVLAGGYERIIQYLARHGAKGQYYGAESIETGLKVAPQAVYFTPAGPAIMAASGVETLATPAGRERIQQQEVSFKEKGVPPALAKAGAYAIPAAEVGLGALGLRSQFKAAQLGAETKLLEKAKLQQVEGLRVEGPKGGVDVITGYMVTKPSAFQQKVLRLKPTEYFTKVTQPYYLTEKGAVMVEGKGFAYAKAGEKMDISRFIVSGRTSEAPGKVALGVDKLRIEGPMQPGAGRVIINQELLASGKVKRVFNPITGEMNLVYKGKVIPKRVKTKTSFVGGGVEEGDLIKFVSGTPKKIRFDLISGKSKLIAKPEAYGKVRRIRVDKISEQGVTKVSTTTPKPKSNINSLLTEQKTVLAKPVTTSYIPTALKEGAKTVLRQPKPKVIPISSLLIAQKPIQKAKQVQIRTQTRVTKQQPLQNLIFSQAVSPSQKIVQVPSVKQAQQIKQEQRVKQILEVKQAEKQKVQQKTVSARARLKQGTPRGGLPPLLIPFRRDTRRTPIRRKKTSRRTQQGRRIVPTITQQLIGFKGRRAISRPSGFEAFRLI